MLDARIADLARRGLEPRLEKQFDDVSRAVGTVVANVGANRIAPGTPGALQTRRPCVAAVAPAVDMAWTNLWRVTTTLEALPTGDELKDELREELAGFFQRLRDLLKERVKFTSGGGAGEPGASLSALETEIRQVIQMFEVEIDLFIHQPRQSHASGSQQAATTAINIYSPVGAVFTGAGSSATIVQRLNDVETRQALRSALADVRASLAEVTETSLVDPTEIVEMTEAASTELNKPKPNAALLGSILFGIATSIQTVASAQQAYQALKAAAASIGIVLP